jgi:hypothetical protein
VPTFVFTLNETERQTGVAPKGWRRSEDRMNTEQGAIAGMGGRLKPYPNSPSSMLGVVGSIPALPITQIKSFDLSWIGHQFLLEWNLRKFRLIFLRHVCLDYGCDNNGSCGSNPRSSPLWLRFKA